METNYGFDELVKTVCDGTMLAAANFIQSKSLKPDMAVVTENIKTVVKACFPGLMNELKAATDAHMGPEIYKSILNTECNLMGIRAVKMALDLN